MSKLTTYLDQYFQFIRHFIPSKPVLPAVGVDIGAGDCKLVAIEKKDDQLSLTHWDVQHFEGDDISSAMKSILDGLGRPCKNPYTSIFGKGSLIRYVEFPRMPLGELKQSFEVESDKYFPFAQDQIYTDCFILDPQGKGKKMSVMAAAVRKEIVDERTSLLNGLDIHPNFIGMNSVALMNVINVLGVADQPQDGQAFALLDMGDSVSSLSVFVKNRPWFTRDIFIGGRDFTKRIAGALGVDLKVAEELKKNPGDKKEDVVKACEFVIMSILQEIRLSFDYFTTEKNVEISKLMLTGGASMLGGINEIFEKHFDMSVSVWDPFEKIKIPEDMQKEFAGQSLRLGVALGLALYDYD